MSDEARAAISAIYRAEWGRIMSSLIRTTGDFGLAEEATQEAFEAALEQWGTGLPEHPVAWIFRTARNIAINRVRRRANLVSKLDAIAAEADARTPEPAHLEHLEIPDDRLRLIFTCCHPALGIEAQVALTLRTLLGLETDEIARAFLVPPPTMAQRIVRAKRKIATAKIPYEVPEPGEMPERLHAVLTVLYVVFTEGYAATRGPSMLRTDLSAEAIRLARVVLSLTGPDPEVVGFLALLLLHDARRDARVDAAGDVVVLDEQDRTRWDAEQIAEALPLVDVALRGSPGRFALQAAIAAEHARADRSTETDWPAIAALYERLEALDPSPIVTLNRAVAVAMVDGPAAALDIIDSLAAGGELDGYHLLHAARADFARRLERFADAAASYLRALELVGNDSERRFLERRLREVRSQQQGA
jgi:RNA polymerase sigma-70 factor (ECF subfamily)